MEEKMIPVDVEAIMKDIRAQIADRSDSEKVLSFDEATAGDACQEGFVAREQFSASLLHHHLVASENGHNIAFYQMIPAGGIKSFIKRSIRKLIAPSIIPIREAQNAYNAEVVQSLYQLEAYTMEREARLEKQEEVLEKMSEQIRALEKRCAALEQK